MNCYRIVDIRLAPPRCIYESADESAGDRASLRIVIRTFADIVRFGPDITRIDSADDLDHVESVLTRSRQ